MEGKTMNTTTTELIVDVRTQLGEPQRDYVRRRLAGQAGISRVEVSEHVPRLLLVQYDTSVTDAQRIRRYLAAKGLPGRLVGM
jgi:hypothetical protein